MNEKAVQAPLIPSLWGVALRLWCLRWIALGPVLGLLFFGWSFADNLQYGIGSWDMPYPQTAQMWSRVDYDSELTDPFFKSNEWSYPWWLIRHPDGHFESTRGFDAGPVRTPPRVKHTARCFCNSFGTRHLVNYCEARLLDCSTIDLLFHVKNPAFRDALRVQIKNGKFTCQYWTFYLAGLKHLIWTTKRQELTLNKPVFSKGDVIKGRISFECLQEITNAKNVREYGKNETVITLNGAFKTVIE